MARFIATEESRTRVLSPTEIGIILRAIYSSDIRRALKLALSLLFITMVRKAELTEATWAEFDLEAGILDIPAERMSTRGAVDRPISKSTLNQAIRALSIDVQHFILHDFRRTASTHLHEMGHPSDAIERALAHKIQGSKGVYNRTESGEQRRAILQAWADFVHAQLDGATITPLFRSAC